LCLTAAEGEPSAPNDAHLTVMLAIESFTPLQLRLQLLSAPTKIKAQSHEDAGHSFKDRWPRHWQSQPGIDPFHFPLFAVDKFDSFQICISRPKPISARRREAKRAKPTMESL
jgi:hypothetical protein